MRQTVLSLSLFGLRTRAFRQDRRRAASGRQDLCGEALALPVAARPAWADKPPFLRGRQGLGRG